MNNISEELTIKKLHLFFKTNHFYYQLDTWNFILEVEEKSGNSTLEEKWEPCEMADFVSLNMAMP